MFVIKRILVDCKSNFMQLQTTDSLFSPERFISKAIISSFIGWGTRAIITKIGSSLLAYLVPNHYCHILKLLLRYLIKYITFTRVLYFRMCVYINFYYNVYAVVQFFYKLTQTNICCQHWSFSRNRLSSLGDGLLKKRGDIFETVR